VRPNPITRSQQPCSEYCISTLPDLTYIHRVQRESAGNHLTQQCRRIDPLLAESRWRLSGIVTEHRRKMPTVLIVDDSEGVRVALRATFETTREFKVVGEAVNGLDAINKAAQLLPDLIVLDLSMPIMNGLEAAESLKSTSPKTPIFILTAHGGPEVDKAARAAGVDAVFSKGQDLDVLFNAARKLFGISAPAGRKAKDK
jgi:CheY-like chemotaxis protein